jgi:hypothetical protein
MRKPSNSDDLTKMTFHSVGMLGGILPHDTESRGTLTDDDRLLRVEEVCVLPQVDKR